MKKFIQYDLAIGFWNIDGLHYRVNGKRYCKTDDEDVISSLKNVDLICLAETHCSKVDDLVLENFLYYQNIRQKSKGAKKHSGGLAFLIKKSIKPGICLLPVSNSEFMWMKLSKQYFNFVRDLYISVVYVCPKNSSFAKKSDDIFELLENDICKFSKDGDILLTGDFNARTNTTPDYCTNDDIGEFIDLPVDYQQDVPLIRFNSDNNPVDFNGDKLLNLCKNTGLRLINGRFLGDVSGHFTCYNYIGKPSVIDYMVASPSILNSINTFHIGNPNEHSIHSTLSLRLKIHSLTTPVEDNNTLTPIRKYKWKCGDSIKYLQSLLKPDINEQLKSPLRGKHYPR